MRTQQTRFLGINSRASDRLMTNVCARVSLIQLSNFLLALFTAWSLCPVHVKSCDMYRNNQSVERLIDWNLNYTRTHGYDRRLSLATPSCAAFSPANLSGTFTKTRRSFILTLYAHLATRLSFHFKRRHDSLHFLWRQLSIFLQWEKYHQSRVSPFVEAVAKCPYLQRGVLVLQVSDPEFERAPVCKLVTHPTCD